MEAIENSRVRIIESNDGPGLERAMNNYLSAGWAAAEVRMVPIFDGAAYVCTIYSAVMKRPRTALEVDDDHRRRLAGSEGVAYPSNLLQGMVINPDSDSGKEPCDG